MSYDALFTKPFLADLEGIEKYLVIKAIKKISLACKNPLPITEGGAGKPLGNQHGINLTGFCELKLQGQGYSYRIIYSLDRKKEVMKLLVIAKRENDFCFKEALQRIQAGA